MDLPQLERLVKYGFLSALVIFPGLIILSIFSWGERALFIVSVIFMIDIIVLVILANEYNTRLNRIHPDFGIVTVENKESIDRRWEFETIPDDEFNEKLEEIFRENSDVLERLAGPPPAPELSQEEIDSIPQRDDCMMEVSGEPCFYPCTYCMWATGELTDEDILEEDEDE